jgi:hypothetical protein
METAPIILKLNHEYPGHHIEVVTDVTDSLEPGRTKLSVFLTVDGRRQAVSFREDEIRRLKATSNEGRHLYEQLAYLIHVRFGIDPSPGSLAATIVGM